MGCSSSKSQQQNNDTCIDLKAISIDIAPVLTEINTDVVADVVDKTIQKGTRLMCQDEYISKHSGVTLHKWRLAEILEIKETNIFIHYIDWSNNFDIWIDLKTEWFKVIPIGFLSPRDERRGAELTEENKKKIVDYWMCENISFKNFQTNNSTNDSQTSILDQRECNESTSFKTNININNANIDQQKISKTPSSLLSNNSKNNTTMPATNKKQSIEFSELKLPNFFKNMKNSSFYNSVTKKVSSNLDLDDLYNSFTSDNADINEFFDFDFKTTNNKNKSQEYVLNSRGEAVTTESLINSIFQKNETAEQEILENVAKEQFFLKKLNELDFKVVNVAGDGNCLFRAVSHQLFLHENDHQELRIRCVQHLRKHKERNMGRRTRNKSFRRNNRPTHIHLQHKGYNTYK